MSSVQQVPSVQDDEALFWLDLAKRVLGGEISPDEAMDLLGANGADVEASGSEN